MMKGLYDVHCHIIPGVDDGADGMKEAVGMLKMEYAEGVRTIIATPHFRYDMFEAPPEMIQKQYLKLKELAKGIGKEGIQLYLGREFHANMEMVDMLKNGTVSSMAGSRYVLVEFSGSAAQNYIKEILSMLISSGYKPIVAHVERCIEMRKDIGFIEQLVRMGAKMQVNSDSVTGRAGFSVKRFCLKLMKNNLLGFIGTDGHGVEYRSPKMRDACAYVTKKMGKSYAKRIFIDNPAKIIR